MARRVIHIEIPWIWFRVCLFLLLETPLVVLYHLGVDRGRATILFVGTVIAAAFALYTFLRGIEDRRVHAAGRIVERWNAPDRAPIRRTMNDLCEGTLDNKLLARGTTDEDLLTKRLHIFSALNFYEELAIGVLDDSIDEDRAYRFFASIIDQTHSKLKDWIARERELDNTPAYYVEFQALAERWRIRKSY